MDRKKLGHAGGYIQADRVYTPEEVRTLLHIGKDLLRRLINAGELRATKLGQRTYRILGSDILEYLGRTEDRSDNRGG